jgi:hypothetical protein
MSPPQILEMAGASALRLRPLGVDFRRAAAWSGRCHRVPLLEKFLPGHLVFSFCSVLWKTEVRVNILFFLIAVFRKTG